MESSKKYEITCPVCGNTKKRLIHLPVAQNYHCLNCDLEWKTTLFLKKATEKIYRQGYYSPGDSGTSGYPDYLAFAESHRRYFKNILKLLSTKGFQQGDLLDIGCGPGLFLQQARSAGFQVTGIDPAADMAEVAKKSKLTVLSGLFENIKLKSDSFDLITCFQTFEHVTHPAKFLEKAFQILKPDGLLLITTPDTDTFWKKLLGNRWFSYQHQEHQYFFNRKSLTALFTNTKFENVEYLSDNFRYYCLTELAQLLSFYTKGKLNIPKFFIPATTEWYVPFPIGSLAVIARKPKVKALIKKPIL